LTGDGGNDTLDGGAGIDRLVGYEGNDTYRFGRTSGQDTIVEADSTGTSLDTVQLDAGILPADVSLLRNGNDLILALDQGPTQLTVSNYFLSAANSAYYKIEQIQFADGTLWNNADIDARVPVTAVNAYTGTTGNDSYLIDNTLDTVTEAPSAGTDSIQSSVSYSLPTDVENLTLTGYFNLSGNGNALDNVIIGNSGNNTLNGSDAYSYSNDDLDTLQGGAGDDTYVLSYTHPYTFDNVVELTGQGTDTVLLQSDYSYGQYTLPDNVENLTLNDASNSLYGLDGNDTLMGTGDQNVESKVTYGWPTQRIRRQHGIMKRAA
jgi:Ca2+-binding RTX toxin-like protein